MTVFRRGRKDRPKDRVYSYEFVYRARTYRGTTGQITKEAALAVERQLKDLARQAAHGVIVHTAAETPRIQEWAEQYFVLKTRRLTDPTSLEYVLRGALKFFGARPGDGSSIPIDPTAPYHDLTLGAVVERPRWIAEFDDWLYARGLSAQTRNHYRSAMSDLYRVATEPGQRETTGVSTNPFAGLARDRISRRTATLTPDELRAWIQHASLHARLAVAIGALAPKLRLRNILALEWRQISTDFRTMTIERHKTASRIGHPLVVAISDPLAAILRARRTASPTSTHVVTYRAAPVKSIRHAIRSAAIEAGLDYGRARARGITFHSLRHTAATALKLAKLPADERQAAMGHASLAMTQWYEHVDVEPERPAMAALAETLALTAATVLDGPRRARRRRNPAAKRPTSSPKSSPRAPESTSDQIRRSPVND